MKNIHKFGFGLLLLWSTLICAQTYKFPKNSEPHGSISLGFGSTKDEIDPAVIYGVDGIDIGERDHYIALAPGKHVLKCRARFDVNTYDYKIPKGQHFKNTAKNNTLEIMIEVGKIYRIGFSVKGTDIKKWKPVIFKVTDTGK